MACTWPLLAGPTAAGAAPGRDPFLAELAGRWHFAGAVRGKHVDYRVRARWALQDGWLVLHLLDVAKPPAYEADVYLGFDVAAGDYVAHWLDQFGAAGARVTATGRRTGRTLVLDFPYDASAFRDTLTLAADGASGSLLIESREASGAWSTFASYSMQRE